VPLATFQCQWCRTVFPDSWVWFVCNRCGHRVCASCLGQQNGRFGRGTKCGQCAHGTMQSERAGRQKEMKAAESAGSCDARQGEADAQAAPASTELRRGYTSLNQVRSV
jgi:hypothetical protein